MRSFRSLIRPAAAVSAIAFLMLAAGCSKPADTDSTGASPAVAAVEDNAGTPSTAVSNLGDLSAFRSIATDVASIVDKGDLPGAKTRIKDLEVAWDSAEAGLKPRAAKDWHVLDKSIDHALSALRADKANLADCKKASAELLQTFDSFQSKK